MLQAFVIDRGKGFAHHLRVAALGSLHTIGLGGAEKGGHLVELHLGPFGEGVIVALGAGDVRAEEGAEGEAEIVEPHPRIAEQVAGRSVVEELPVGRHHRVDHLVPGFIDLDLVFQPILVGVEADLVGLVGDTHHVREVIEEMAAVAIGIQQLVNDLGPLRNARIIDELKGFLAGRDAAGDVEIDPPDELLVRSERIRLQLGLCQARVHQVVDAGGGLGEPGIGGDAESLRLQSFGRLLVGGREPLERQTVDVAIADL